MYENGANIYTKNNKALTSAIENEHFEVTEFLIENSDADKIDINECLSNSPAKVEFVNLFLVNGAKKKYAKNVLMLSYNKINLLKFLFESGVNIFKIEVLNNACKANNINVVKFLIKKRMDIHNKYEEAIEYACRNNNIDLIKNIKRKWSRYSF